MLIEGVRMAGASKVTQSQHPCKDGGTTPSHDNCSVSARLYSQVHVCNHARCASNDPDYNVKSAIPARKFLVAKKHAYGGLENKGENTRTSSGSSSPAPNQQRDPTHALKSLAYSVVTTESGSNHGKIRSNELGSIATSAVQSGPALRYNSKLSSDTKMVVRRKLRPTAIQTSSVPFGSSTKRSCVTTPKSHFTARKTRLNSSGSISSTPVTEKGKQWEDSTSPDNSFTSFRITQIISTRREEKEGEGEAAAPSATPTASVGSNHDTEYSSLKETVIVVQQVGIFEQPNANFGNLQSPASSSSSILHKNSGKKEATFDSPSASSSYRPPGSKSPTPSTESTAPRLLKSAVAQEEINCRSSTPSVDSRESASRSLTSSVTSLKSAGPRLTRPTSTVRSFPTIVPPSSSDKLAKKLITDLRESQKVWSPLSSSSPASATRPSGNPTKFVSAATVDTAHGPKDASTLAKTLTDLQARSLSRRSTKGVGSIELRGGNPPSYSTTTVSSWNMTTTTVETSVLISEIANAESGLAGSRFLEVHIKPEDFGKEKSLTATAGANFSAVDLKNQREAPTIMNFAKSARSSPEDVHAKPEIVTLKHDQFAERRLSEEHMTNHALEGLLKTVSENDHRVKILVNAFETLATLTDSEALAMEEKTLNQRLGQQSLIATSIAV